MRVSSLGVALPLAPETVRALARAVLRGEGRSGALLSITFVGRRQIRALNRRFLGRDRETDVLAFALKAPAAPLVGDVYCAPTVAAAEARRYGCTRDEEVRRQVVHGILHVLGYDHPEGMWARGHRGTGAGKSARAAHLERTASPMWRRQERYLAPGRRRR